jgi:putative DNA primase/helicase
MRNCERFGPAALWKRLWRTGTLTLKARMCAEGPPGILRWAIDGCLAWQRQGLGNCDAVRAATGSHFQQQDHIRRWMDERCELSRNQREDYDRDLKARPGRLLGDYLMWARASGEAAMNSTEFKEHLERTSGIRYGRTGKTGQWVYGIALDVVAIPRLMPQLS